MESVVRHRRQSAIIGPCVVVFPAAFLDVEAQQTETGEPAKDEKADHSEERPHEDDQADEQDGDKCERGDDHAADLLKPSTDARSSMMSRQLRRSFGRASNSEMYASSPVRTSKVGGGVKGP